MLGYVDNNTRYMYKLYNRETKRFITTIYFKWAEWKMTYTAETLNIFRDMHKDDLVPGIEEDKITMLELKENIPVHLIPD